MDWIRARAALIRDILVILLSHLLHCLDLYKPYRILFSRDNFHNYLPIRAILHHRLQAGELPLWNPYLYMGIPYLADPVSGVLYPPHWLLALDYDYRMMTTLIVAAHYLLAQILMYGFLRSLKLPGLAAVGGAIVYVTCGYVSMETTAHQMLYAHAWLPGFAWALNAHLGGVRFGLPLAVAACSLMLYGGDPQSLVLALAASGPVVLWRWRGKPLRAVGTLAALTLFPFVLYLPVLLPMLDFAAESARSSMQGLPQAIAWSFHPLRLLELFAPNLFGRSIGDLTFWAERPDGPFAGGFYTDSAYMGFATIPFVMGALITGTRRRELWFWTGLAAAGFLVAMGQHLPFYRWLYEYLPGWRLFRYPERLLIVPSFALAAAWAIATEGLVAGRRGGTVLCLLAGAMIPAGLWLTSLGDWLVALGDQKHFFPGRFHVSSISQGALAVCLLTALVLWLRPVLGGERLMGLLVALVLADTVSASRGPMMTMDARLLRDAPPVVHLFGLGPHRQGPVAHVTDRASVDAYVMAGSAPEDRYRRELRMEFIARMYLAWETMESAIAGALGYVTPDGPSENSYHLGLYQLKQALPEFDLYRLLGVGFMTSRALGRMSETGWTPLGKATLSGLQVYRAPWPAQPVICPARSETVADFGSLVERSRSADFSPETVALFVEGETGTSGNQFEGGPPAAAQNCRVTDWRHERVVIGKDDPAPRWVVYRRAHSKGWKAYLGGKPVPVRLAWGLFPAVHVPEGKHEIVLSYEPDAVALGFWTGAIAWCLWVSWLFGLAVHRRVEIAYRLTG